MANLLDIEQLKKDYLLNGLELVVECSDGYSVDRDSQNPETFNEVYEELCTVYVKDGKGTDDYYLMLLDNLRITAGQLSEYVRNGLRDYITITFGTNFEDVERSFKYSFVDSTKNFKNGFVPENRFVPKHEDVNTTYSSYLFNVFNILKEATKDGNDGGLKGYVRDKNHNHKLNVSLFTEELKNYSYIEDSLPWYKINWLFGGIMDSKIKWLDKQYLLAELVDQLDKQGFIQNSRKWIVTAKVFAIEGHKLTESNLAGARSEREPNFKQKQEIEAIVKKLKKKEK